MGAIMEAYEAYTIMGSPVLRHSMRLTNPIEKLFKNNLYCVAQRDTLNGYRWKSILPW